jgi:hypothetical protein
MLRLGQCQWRNKPVQIAVGFLSPDSSTARGVNTSKFRDEWPVGGNFYRVPAACEPAVAQVFLQVLAPRPITVWLCGR